MDGEEGAEPQTSSKLSFSWGGECWGYSSGEGDLDVPVAIMSMSGSSGLRSMVWVLFE